MAADYLFAGASIQDVIRAREERVREFVIAMDADLVLSTPELDLVDRLVDQFRIECPILRVDDRYSPGARDTRIDVTGDFRRATFGPGPHYVQGTRLDLHIPFDGDAGAFKFRPSTFSMNPPTGSVRGNEIVVTAAAPADALDPQQIAEALDRQVGEIETNLTRLRADVDAYNQQLRERAGALVAARRQKVLADRALEEHLAVPVARRPGRSETLALDVARKRTEIRPPVSTTKAFAPEPAISREQFEDITSVISSLGKAVERFPDTFGPMGEETLREILLVVLNNQFGPAVGELFSRQGKTDVAIVASEGPVFIGECKIWTGPSAFADAIDQLLGYLVWRDTKAALILFVKNKNVSAVVGKAGDGLSAHRLFKRAGAPCAEHPVFILHHDGDMSREIEVVLVVVPIPTQEQSGAPGG
jgi:hypothetical protein